MKIKLFLALCILQFSNYSYSGEKNEKNDKVIYGPKIEESLEALNLEYVDNKLHFFYKNRIEFFDPDVVRVDVNPNTLAQEGKPQFITRKKKESGFVADAKQYGYLKTISSNTSEVHFFSYLEDKDQTIYLFYQVAGKDLVPLSSPVKIAKRKFLEVSDFDFNYRKGDFTIGINKSKTIIYVICQAPNKVIDKKKDEYSPGEVTITYYDAKDMKELNTATYNLGVNSFGDFAFMGDEGMMYSLIKTSYKEELEVIKSNGKIKKEERFLFNYKVMALNVNKPETLPVEKNISFNDQYVFNVKLDLKEDGSIFCSGTKSEREAKRNPKKINSIFTCNLNPKSLEIGNLNEIKLEKELEYCLDGSDNVDPSYRVIGMEKMENGTTTFILEENVNYLQRVDTKNSSYDLRFYFHGNIALCNVDAKNNVNWITNFYRKESHSNYDYSYFYFKKCGNKINFVFNDAKSSYDKNTLQLKPNLQIKDISEIGGVDRIAMATLDETGSFSCRLTDINSLSFEYAFDGFAWSDNGKEFFFNAYSRKNVSKIVKVLFD